MVSVSPTEKIRAEIDALFDGERGRGGWEPRGNPAGRPPDHPDRAGGPGSRSSSAGAVTSVPPVSRVPAGPQMVQRPLPGHDQDDRRAGDGGPA